MAAHHYLRIEGDKEWLLPGDVVRVGKAWSEIESYSFDKMPGRTSFENEAGVHKGDVPKAMKVVRQMDMYSPRLAGAIRDATILETLLIESTQGAGHEESVTWRITLHSATLSDYQLVKSTDSFLQHDIVTLDFGAIEFNLQLGPMPSAAQLSFDPARLSK
jgi:type VI protein secretion system component Hcp